MTIPTSALPVPAHPPRRNPTSRRLIAWFLIVGGVGMVPLVVGMAAISALMFQQSGRPAAPPVLFAAGEELRAPEAGLLNTGTLVVYGRSGVDGSTTLQLDCGVTSAGGTERSVGLAIINRPDDVMTDQGPLVPLASVDTWRERDRVVCDGPEAASYEPLALGVDRGKVGTIATGALVLAVAALVFGAAVLAAGVALLRRQP